VLQSRDRPGAPGSRPPGRPTPSRCRPSFGRLGWLHERIGRHSVPAGWRRHAVSDRVRRPVAPALHAPARKAATLLSARL